MQTSIEWLTKELSIMIMEYIPLDRWDEIRDSVNKAKEIHKQEIIDAYKYGNLSDVYFKPEQYYQETFKKD
jgi:hypothetical protein